MMSGMFSGIVEQTARLVDVSESESLRRLTIDCALDDVRIGASIAINGVCLTVSNIQEALLTFDAVAETLSRTNLAMLRVGDIVNVERSLRVGDRVDGHFVQGHVDGTARLVNKFVDGNDWRMQLEVPPALARYLVPKGSIALDGVSLTVAAVHDRIFDVAVIPTTLKVTNLATRNVGWPFNFEADMIVKAIARVLEIHPPGTKADGG
jgi:riboflavin synthase